MPRGRRGPGRAADPPCGLRRPQDRPGTAATGCLAAVAGSPPIDLLARAELLPGVGLDALEVVGAAAFGARAIFGWGAPRLEGTNLRAAADARDVQYVVIGPDGIGAVDATVWLVTDDGASIRADYAGEIVLSDSWRPRWSGAGPRASTVGISGSWPGSSRRTRGMRGCGPGRSSRTDACVRAPWSGGCPARIDAARASRRRGSTRRGAHGPGGVLVVAAAAPGVSAARRARATGRRSRA